MDYLIFGCVKSDGDSIKSRTWCGVAAYGFDLWLCRDRFGWQMAIYLSRLLSLDKDLVQWNMMVDAYVKAKTSKTMGICGKEALSIKWLEEHKFIWWLGQDTGRRTQQPTFFSLLKVEKIWLTMRIKQMKRLESLSPSFCKLRVKLSFIAQAWNCTLQRRTMEIKDERSKTIMESEKIIIERESMEYHFNSIYMFLCKLHDCICR